LLYRSTSWHEFLYSLGDFASLPAPPIHYGAFDIFVSTPTSKICKNLWVALGNAPILTQVLVKERQFAPVRPPPPTPTTCIWKDWIDFLSLNNPSPNRENFIFILRIIYNRTNFDTRSFVVWLYCRYILPPGKMLYIQYNVSTFLRT